MGTQSKGKCKYCGKEYTKGYMCRHLAGCKERKARIASEKGIKKCGYFELVICAKYDSNYWLIIEISENATLKDVDVFLRFCQEITHRSFSAMSAIRKWLLPSAWNAFMTGWACYARTV